MKKSILYIFSISVLLFSLFSCEDDEYSKKHVYTDEEIALRDSLEAAKQNIKANYIFKYTVTLPRDTVNYRNIEVKVDSTILLEKLGMNSLSEVATAMGTVNSGAQEDATITFFAINGSTRYDNTAAFTANGFGHWFDANGDVCSWGDNDRLFSELDPATFTFFIGQHPKHLKSGEKYKIIQAIKKGDYRIAFVFDITVGPDYKEVIPEAENVATYNLSLNVLQDNNYAATDLTFDFAAAASAIGTTTSDLSSNKTFYGFNSDGTKTSSYTADAGYWLNKSGYVCNWGAEACALYVNYEDGVFHIGQFPNATVEGDSFTFNVALMYKTTKMVTYNVKVKVIGYVDPETPPAGSPETVTQSYTVNLPYTGGWDNSIVDVKELLRNTFKMTTYQIHKAIDNGTLKFYGLSANDSIYKDENGNPASTAAAPGHWFDASGNVTTWGNTTNVPVCFSELHHTNESLEFSIGNHPENTKAGDTFTFRQIAELNGGKVTFTFTLKL